jgi:hypothetical protein
VAINSSSHILEAFGKAKAPEEIGDVIAFDDQVPDVTI